MLSSSIEAISLGDVVPFIAIFCLLFACCSYRVEQRELCVKYFLAGYITTSVLGLFKSLTRLSEIMSVDYLSAYSWEDTLRFSGLSYDANFYAIIALITLCILLFGFQYRFRSNFVWTIMTFTTVVLGMLTYSKSFYLPLFLILVISVIKTDKNIRTKIIKAIPLMLILCFIFRAQMGIIVNLFLIRLTESDGVNGLTTGRYELWVEYLQRIGSSFESIVIGNGVRSVGLKAAHNTYLEIIYKFGLLGLLVDIGYMGICIKLVGLVKHKKSINEIATVLLLLLLFFNLSAYTFLALWSCLFMTIILIRTPGIE
jgi:hypothetical protein